MRHLNTRDSGYLTGVPARVGDTSLILLNSRREPLSPRARAIRCIQVWWHLSCLPACAGACPLPDFPVSPERSRARTCLRPAQILPPGEARFAALQILSASAWPA